MALANSKTEPKSADQILAAAEHRRGALRARMEIARADLAGLGTSTEKALDTYLNELARAEIDGGEVPSRSPLAELQEQLPAAEDRVAALERALGDLERDVRVARADVLAEQAAAVRAETVRRQARIHELEPQIEDMQREIHQHSSWIVNQGPTTALRLEAEARTLRSAS